MMKNEDNSFCEWHDRMIQKEKEMIKVNEHINPETKTKIKEFVDPHDVIRKKILDSAMKGNVDACHYLLQNRFDGELCEALDEYLKSEEKGEELTKNLKRVILEEHLEDEDSEEFYTFSSDEVKAARDGIVRAAKIGNIEACQYILEQSKNVPYLDNELNEVAKEGVITVGIRRDSTGRIFIDEIGEYDD